MNRTVHERYTHIPCEVINALCITQEFAHSAHICRLWPGGNRKRAVWGHLPRVGVNSIFFYETVRPSCGTQLLVLRHVVIWWEAARLPRQQLNPVWLWQFFVFVSLIALCKSSSRGPIISCRVRARIPSAGDALSPDTENRGLGDWLAVRGIWCQQKCFVPAGLWRIWVLQSENGWLWQVLHQPVSPGKHRGRVLSLLHLQGSPNICCNKGTRTDRGSVVHRARGNH